jgi:3-phosphoshikimate 1-carboxyvinyltransferase
MDIQVFPSQIQGVLQAPASKSYMLRAVALAMLSESPVRIQNPSYCDDALAVLNIAESFGCGIEKSDEFLIIEPGQMKPPKQFSCGESGLAIRLFTPVAAIFDKTIRLEAEGSLKNRPADFMQNPMQQLGAEFLSDKGKPPVQVKGPLKAGDITLDGSLSSQFLSGLLIALPKIHGRTNIKVKNLKSIPYIRMTLEALEAFGAEISHNKFEEFTIQGPQKYQTEHYTVESDWSSAAALLTAGALAGSMKLKNISPLSLQADRAVLDALKQTGSRITTNASGIRIEKPKKLKSFRFDAVHSPDLFPALAALASACEGQSKIYGLHRLKHKESDRGKVLQNEFKKIGGKITLDNDRMLIEGGKIMGGQADANNDHRIAMALSLAALNSENPVTICGAECVNKSYPKYFEDMQEVGVKLDVRYKM